MIFIKLATRDAPQVTHVKYPTCWKHLLANTSSRKLPHVTQNFATIECVACPNGVVLHRVDGAISPVHTSDRTCVATHVLMRHNLRQITVAVHTGVHDSDLSHLATDFRNK